MKTKTQFTNRILSLVLALLMVLGMLPMNTLTASAVEAADLAVAIDTGVSVTLKDADGDGYYDIGTADELYAFAAAVNGGNNAINGELTADIEVNQNVLNEDGALNGDGSNFRAWFPIGYCYDYDGDGIEEDIYFKGTFDGSGHTVSGLYFNNEGQGSVGLFGEIYSGATVKNVGVIDSYFNNTGINSDSGNFVGGVVGYSLSSTVTNCYNTGTISGSGECVGGVVGYSAHGTVTNCYNTGTISRSSDGAGGVVGHSTNSTVTNCYNTGTVRGNTYVGGVVGYSTGNVANCYNTGTISGSGNFVGGVVGSAYGTVTNCCYRTDCATNGNGIAQYGIGNLDLNGKTADVSGQTEARTAEQFASGEVAYLLNGDQSTIVFKQTLSENGDAFPNFTGAKVYYGYLSCADDAVMVYTNDSGATDTKPGHTPGENGSIIETDTHTFTCGVCGVSVTGAHTMDSTTGKCACGLEMAEASATVGGVTTYYGTLNEAIQAVSSATAADNATVKLLKDIDLVDATQWVTSGVFTLDLNGQKLKTADIGLSISGANVTIADSSDSGTGQINGGTFGAEAGSGSTVKILGGTVGGNIYGVFANNGTVEISGGTVNGVNYGVFANNGILEISGGTVSGGTDGIGVWATGSTVEISDGTVSGEDGVFAYDNSTVMISSGTVSGEDYGVQAYDNSTVTISGGTVSGEGHGVYASEDCTVTISGGTVSGDIGVFVCENSTVEISDGTVSGSDYGVFAYDDGTMEIGGGAVNGGEYGVYACESTVEISGGTVSGGDGVISEGNSTVEIIDGEASGDYGVYAEENSTVEISGGTVSGDIAVYADNSTVEISDGAVNGNVCGVLAEENSTVEIRGDATVSGGYDGVYADNSTVTISGGSISGTTYDINSNNASVTLTLAESATKGATFPGGITVAGTTLKAILGEGVAYWQGEKMIVPTEDQTKYTLGDVTVKAACIHENGTLSYTPNTDNQYAHDVTWSCCGAVETEFCGDITHSVSSDGATCTVTCNDCKRVHGILTIVAPACTVYGDGKSCEAAIRLDGEPVEGNLAFTYYRWTNGQWSKLDAAPTNAGTYRAEFITFDDTYYDDKDVIIYVEYTITKREITITVEAKNTVVNTTLPAYTYKVEGLVGEDKLVTEPTLTCNADIAVVGEYEITATGADAGSNYSIKYVPARLTVLSDNAVDAAAGYTEELKDYDPATLTSEDKTELEEMLSEINTILDDETTTDNGKKALEEVKEQVEGLIKEITEAAEATDTENTEKVENVTPENVTPENKTDLENAKTDLEKALEVGGGNYTEDEKKAIEDEIKRIDDALEVIGNVEAVEEKIEKLPENITKNDEDAIKAVDDAYNALSDYEKSLVDEAAKKALTDAKAALAELNKPADTNSPTTGDDFNIVLYASLMAVSVTALVVLLLVSKKRKYAK